jgi:hypothetical protein
MPSEIVLIAWGGGIATVAAAIGGTMVGLFVQRNTVKLQLESRRKELADELAHRDREARRTRLADTRREYLVPLRAVLNERSMVSQHLAGMTGQLLAAKDEQDQQAITEVAAAISTLMKESHSIEILFVQLRGQVSDAELESLLVVIESNELEQGLRRSHLARAVNTPGGDAARDEALLAEIQLTQGGVREHLRTASIRIEQLLVGDD